MHVHIHADFSHQFLGSTRQTRAIDKPKFLRCRTELQILCNTQIGAKGQLLMHQSNAKFLSSERIGGMHLLSLDFDDTSVGSVDAAHDFS